MPRYRNRIDYSQIAQTWHANPCPNPRVPPMAIELSDIRIPTTDEHYMRARAVVEAYWSQATNMTTADQQEYRTLFYKKFYIVQNSTLRKPSNHRLYRACRARPTWAKFVFFHAIYPQRTLLDNDMLPLFGSLEICDFQEAYRDHHPLVVSSSIAASTTTAVIPATISPAASLLSVASPSTVSSASSLPAAAQDMTILQLRAIIAGVERRLNGRLDNLETRLDNSDEKVDQCANDIDTKVAVPLNNIVNLLALMMDRDGMAPVDSLSGIE